MPVRRLTITRKPENTILPEPGQESVWDYPRPPTLKPDERLVTVEFGGIEIARSSSTIRVLETSHPPAFYIPPGDVLVEYFRPSERASFCEFKGQAVYFNIRVGDRTAANAAWCYPHPQPEYAAIGGYFSFYPGKMDSCTVDGDTVTPQPGDFYGGWITAEIVGPFKGEPGTEGW